MRLESPWQPSVDYLASLPDQHMLLLSPSGRYHLMLDNTGQWWHLVQNGTPDPIDAGRAAQLRPTDCDLVMKTTLIWAWKTGADEAAATTAIDELAAGIKNMVVHYALAPRDPMWHASAGAEGKGRG